MNTIHYYGGLCKDCNEKLEFRTTPVEDTDYHMLFAVCTYCEKVFMLELVEEEITNEDLMIDYKEQLEGEFEEE